jgi:hypothetical protein
MWRMTGQASSGRPRQARRVQRDKPAVRPHSGGIGPWKGLHTSQWDQVVVLIVKPGVNTQPRQYGSNNLKLNHSTRSLDTN